MLYLCEKGKNFSSLIHHCNSLPYTNIDIISGNKDIMTTTNGSLIKLLVVTRNGKIVVTSGNKKRPDPWQKSTCDGMKTAG